MSDTTQHIDTAPGAADTARLKAIGPGDQRYDDLVTGNNSRWVAHPEAVYVVRDTQDVVRAVQQAVTEGKRLSVRGGGHCYADFVFNPDVRVVIDMSAMDDVCYDEEHQAFAVQGGATLLRVYETLYKGWGVTIPGGMCYSVGVGGHVSGGGYGMISRKHGLSVDHLYAVEVVVVDRAGHAKAVVATREADDPHRDLWWAHTGGGGGNFGVITRYWFRTPGTRGHAPSAQLPHPPKDVLLNAVALSWDELDEPSFIALVRNYGAWHERNSGPESPYASQCSILMLNHKANGSVALLTQIDAGVPGAGGLLDDFVQTVTASIGVKPRPMTQPAGEHGAKSDFFEPRLLPWFSAARLLGVDNPTLANPTLRGIHKSAYMRRGFTDTQLSAMYRHLTRVDFSNPNAMVVLASIGGQINTVGRSDTATVQRDSVMKALFQTFWVDPGDDAEQLGWARAAYGEVFATQGGYPVPGEATDGCYINYADSDITDPSVNTSGVPWHDLYYQSNYPRLQRVKAAYDPRNIFHHSQSITPSTGGSHH